MDQRARELSCDDSPEHGDRDAESGNGSSAKSHFRIRTDTTIGIKHRTEVSIDVPTENGA